MTVTGVIADSRRVFHQNVAANLLFINEDGVLSNADKGSAASKKLSEALAIRLCSPPALKQHLKGQQAGAIFEVLCRQFLQAVFPRLQHLRPGTWQIGKLAESGLANIAHYEQYSHLKKLAAIASKDRELAAVLQSDYLITPDIVIARLPEPDEVLNANEAVVDDEFPRLSSLRRRDNKLPLLHASISCKWTLRSDRGQNVRTEGLNLVKNRKGHLPHVVFVTGEPLPTRIASVAMGTGEIDCVYHFALPELQSAVAELGSEEAQETLQIMVEGHRLKDIADLPLDLAI